MALDPTIAIVTLQDARLYVGKGETDTGDDELLDSLINAASGMVANELGVASVVSNTYREYRDAQPGLNIWLNNYPVTSVRQVSVARDQAMTVSFTAGTASYATVEVTKTAVNLRQRVSGVLTSTELLLTSYATLTLLEAAIEAISGWVVVTSTDFASYSPTSLVPVPARNARDQSIWLEVPDEGEVECELKGDWGRLYNPYGWSYGSYGWRNKAFSSNAATADEANLVYIEYVAGYARGSIPAPIKSACLEMVSLLYNLSQRDATLKSETIGEYKYEISPMALGVKNLPGAVKFKLDPYKRQMLMGA